MSLSYFEAFHGLDITEPHSLDITAPDDSQEQVVVGGATQNHVEIPTQKIQGGATSRGRGLTIGEAAKAAKEVSAVWAAAKAAREENEKGEGRGRGAHSAYALRVASEGFLTSSRGQAVIVAQSASSQSRTGRPTTSADLEVLTAPWPVISLATSEELQDFILSAERTSKACEMKMEEMEVEVNEVKAKKASADTASKRARIELRARVGDSSSSGPDVDAVP